MSHFLCVSTCSSPMVRRSRSGMASLHRRGRQGMPCQDGRARLSARETGPRCRGGAGALARQAEVFRLRPEDLR